MATPLFRTTTIPKLQSRPVNVKYLAGHIAAISKTRDYEKNYTRELAVFDTSGNTKSI